MDCKTARLMLEFARPHHVELESADLHALEAHVAACPECGLASKQQRAFDEQLGQAMRQVDVPDRLRARLLDRLADDRAAARKWRRKAAVTGALAAAAALLLVVGGWMVYHQVTLKPLLPDLIVEKENERGAMPPTAKDIEEEFRHRGVAMTAPASLNYTFLAFYGLGELQEQQVPCLVFIRDDKTANIHAHAKVYVVSDREFKDVKKLSANYQSPPGYKYKVDLERDPGSRYVYVIVHTGDNLDWLRQPDISME